MFAWVRIATGHVVLLYFASGAGDVVYKKVSVYTAASADAMHGRFVYWEIREGVGGQQ